MIEFTAAGFIEVWKDAKVVSRHRAEREAIESCARHGDGQYILTYPSVTVDVTGAAPSFGVINGAVHA